MTNIERRLDNVSKWVFSSSGVGRDATYTLISLFLLVYIQFTVTLSVAQFSALSLIIVICRVWDAVNDPMMGTIIENTKSRFGKFKPWIIAGAITNSITIIVLFWIRPEGWAFVAFFGVTYLLWGMTFTMNDISWWSMIPALTSDAKTRDQLMTLVAFFASAGAFIVGGLVPVLTTGQAVEAYRVIGLVVALAFVLCQCAVLLFVSENRDTDTKKEKIRFQDMFRIISRNKQLLWAVVSLFLLYLLGAIINSLGMTFFYFEFGYSGAAMSTFIIFYAVGTLLGTGLYPLLRKKFNRARLIRGAVYMMTLGYLIMFLTGYLPFIPHSMWSFCVGGLIIFTGQAVMYLIILVQLTNTIEYEQYLTGTRNEAILFSLRPLTAKASSAVQQGLVSLILIVSGIYSLSNRIATLEQQKASVSVDISGPANAIIDQATPGMLLMLRAGITLVPMIMAWMTYYLLKKKYHIDEETYEVILAELRMREKDPEHFDISAIRNTAVGMAR